MLLGFQIGKEKHNAVCKSRRANNGNDKYSETVVYKEKVYCRNHNTGPNGYLNRLTDTVEFNKVGGEYHLPYDEKCENDDDAPKGTANAKVDNRCRHRDA